MRPRAKRFLQATKISASSGRIRWARGSGSPGPGTQRPVGRTVGPWSLLGKAGFSAAGEGAAFALLCLLPRLDQRSGLLKAAWQTRRTGVKNAPTALEQRAWKTPPLSLKAEAVQRKHSRPNSVAMAHVLRVSQCPSLTWRDGHRPAAEAWGPDWPPGDRNPRRPAGASPSLVTLG